MESNSASSHITSIWTSCIYHITSEGSANANVNTGFETIGWDEWQINYE